MSSRSCTTTSKSQISKLVSAIPGCETAIRTKVRFGRLIRVHDEVAADEASLSLQVLGRDIDLSQMIPYCNPPGHG